MNMVFSLEDVKFDGDGLVPVIVQDVLSGEVLMMAWANREALEAALSSGMMTFWSRSRREIWKKGETSGNTLALQELRLDCDGDALLALAEPAGPACHTGERTCFHRLLTPPCEGRGTFPGVLWRYLEKRRFDDPAESYTARLLSKGLRRVAQKVGEEGVETALAVAAGDRKETVCEAADLLYHLEAALLASGVSPREVYAELERRHR
ncbi:MAG: phosphoribosyl-AMP cyclohydrolase / phosphoribosyl-ATP pyrophosphohydrolase [Synergistaceae bacterium]|jgi:phosphoribosyl-ATP pyrophosphohydrolase/phosphoribosyl-AMP cyclohydrolase|nr:phosphoribosyl-AMP cyclohydrolase / phosphoribosyl-ATP pyrophosphohydrolase [Synergistaceae bacterium]